MPSSPAAFPLTKVISSDNTEVTFHVSFPPTRPEKVGDGIPYMQVLSPGMGNVSSMFSLPKGETAQATATAVGLPQLPVTGDEIALPQGGSAVVQVLHTSSYLLPAVQLWPLQPGTEAASTSSTGAPLPPPAPTFSINQSGYRSSEEYPSALAVATPPDSEHGLAVGDVALAGGQYRPAQASTQGPDRHGGTGQLRRDQSKRVRDHTADDTGRPPVRHTLAVQPV